MSSEAEKAEKAKQDLREALAGKSKELLEVELFEKTMYANTLLATYNSLETQHRRMESEKARIERDLTDFRRANNILREQNDMLTEVVKLLVGVKKEAAVALSVAQTVIKHALDPGQIFSIPEAMDLVKKLLTRPTKKQKLVRKK